MKRKKSLRIGFSSSACSEAARGRRRGCRADGRRPRRYLHEPVDPRVAGVAADSSRSLSCGITSITRAISWQSRKSCDGLKPPTVAGRPSASDIPPQARAAREAWATRTVVEPQEWATEVGALLHDLELHEPHYAAEDERLSQSTIATG